jgi:hypothetical protein
MRRWRGGSEFGPGRRVPLCRERRAVWKARLHLARRAGRITPAHVDVGDALLRRQGVDGRLDPSHATLAADAGHGERTVRRALGAMQDCGMVAWDRRLVRSGWAARQTSNAYVLTVGETADFPAPRYGGQHGRQTLKEGFQLRKEGAQEQGGAALAELLREAAGLPDLATQRRAMETRIAAAWAARYPRLTGI